MAAKRTSRRSRRSRAKEYRVLIGGVGTVLKTGKRAEALAIYKDYLAASMAGVGRAAAQSVGLFCGDKPLREYEPSTRREFAGGRSR